MRVALFRPSCLAALAFSLMVASAAELPAQDSGRLGTRWGRRPPTRNNYQAPAPQPEATIRRAEASVPAVPPQGQVQGQGTVIEFYGNQAPVEVVTSPGAPAGYSNNGYGDYSYRNYGLGGYGLGGYGMGHRGMGSYGLSTMGWGNYGSPFNFSGYSGFAESSAYDGGPFYTRPYSRW